MHGSDALMPENAFTRALEKTKEIKISVIGRNTGKPITLPVWFVHENDTLWLLPVSGSKTQWYQNLRKNPTITIKAGKEERTLNAHVLKTAATVGNVIHSFQQKYKPEMIAKFYPGPLDVAVKVEV
jgi:deazaflavin-dependent oxidoreductase (nitroreductase family)